MTADEEFDALAALMEETPAADNFGRSARVADDETRHRHASLQTDPLAGDGVREAFTFVHPDDVRWHGITGGTKVLTDAEAAHLDWDRVRQMVAEELGVPWEEAVELYRPGPGRPTAALAARRARLDEAVLRANEAGGHTIHLAAVFGWPVTPSNGECDPLRRALARARKARLRDVQPRAPSYIRAR